MKFWSMLIKLFIPTVICTTFQDKSRVCIYARGKFLSRATLTRLAPFPQHCSFHKDAAPQCCECIWLRHARQLRFHGMKTPNEAAMLTQVALTAFEHRGINASIDSVTQMSWCRLYVDLHEHVNRNALSLVFVSIQLVRYTTVIVTLNQETANAFCSWFFQWIHLM